MLGLSDNLFFCGINLNFNNRTNCPVTFFETNINFAFSFDDFLLHFGDSISPKFKIKIIRISIIFDCHRTFSTINMPSLIFCWIILILNIWYFEYRHLGTFWQRRNIQNRNVDVLTCQDFRFLNHNILNLLNLNFRIIGLRDLSENSLFFNLNGHKITMFPFALRGKKISFLLGTSTNFKNSNPIDRLLCYENSLIFNFLSILVCSLDFYLIISSLHQLKRTW